jgi:PAS domain S-box-containing protein
LSDDVDDQQPAVTREALRRSPYPAFIMDPVRDAAGAITELTYSFVNDAALSLYRMSIEDVVGHGLLELFPSSLDNGIFDADVRAIQTQDRVDIVVPWVDEHAVQGAFTMRAVPYGQGVLVTAVDVTAEQLAQSNQRYRLIAGAASDVVYTRSTDDVVTWVSPSVTKVLGWPVEEFVGVSVRDLVHPDDLAATVHFPSPDDEADAGRVEMRYATADGRWRWISVLTEVIHNDQGTVTGVMDALRDVQSEVEAREALERSEITLRATQRLARLGTWQWDPAIDHVEWSDELFTLFGQDPSQPAPDFAEQAELYEAQSWEQLNRAVAQAMETGAPFELELQYVGADSGPAWMHTRGETVRDEHDLVVGLRGYVLDITKRKHREDELRRSNAELARSNAELEQFAMVVSHDLRSPLVVVRGALEVVPRLSETLSPDLERLLDRATANTLGLLGTVDGLLQLARVGREPVTIGDVDAREVVADVAELLRAQLDEAGAVLDVADLPTVRADPAQFRVVCQNLIANAVKYRHHARSLRIVVAAADRGDAWLFTVQDNGQGFAAVDSEVLFEPFGRTAEAEKVEGAGIGLATCRRIVERHGGTIHAEPLDPGARFFFTLPKNPTPR